MALETYTLTEADMNAIYTALKHYNPENDPEGGATVDLKSLQLMELTFETAEAATVTYEGPDDGEILCGNCGKLLENIVGNGACSSECDEAIVERYRDELLEKIAAADADDETAEPDPEDVEALVAAERALKAIRARNDA